jgi:hypothetical protein
MGCKRTSEQMNDLSFLTNILGSKLPVLESRLSLNAN